MKKSNLHFIPLESAGLSEVRLRGRKLIHFSGCDYFRLAHDPRLAAAAKKELAATGLNVSASRLTTGDRAIYHRLETALAIRGPASAEVGEVAQANGVVLHELFTEVASLEDLFLEIAGTRREL